MMSTSRIWLPLMEVMAQSCDVVVLIDEVGMLREVVTAASLGSELVTTAAVGMQIDEILSSGHVSIFAGAVLAAERNAEMRVSIIDPEGRIRECQCSVVNLPPIEGGRGWHLLALNDRSSHRSRENALNHRAIHDQLTGLVNRAALLDRLDHSMLRVDRVSDPVVVVFIDLDEFKPINDRFGHEVGDQMLAQIGARIAAVAGRSDTVARLGGDEFAILIDHRESSGSQDRVGRGIDLAQRLLEAISQPVTVVGVTANISASIGLAVAGPESSTSSLLHDADLAMYAAKRSGRGQIRIFDPAMRQRAARHVEYRRELPSAISHDQLRVVYLPHFDLPTRQVLGWEALVRWDHPDLGAVEPDEFVPIAERAGLMGEIGAWVRRRAAAEFGSQVVDTAIDRKSPAADLSRFLCLNLSHSELRDTHSAAAILGDLDEACLAFGDVIIEISESVFDLADPVMMAVVSELRCAGVRIALDDVGAGTSSVSLLHEAPVDIVKLSPAVVATSHLGAASLAATFVQMCRRRGLWVIAEGIETEEHYEALIALGCESGHGRWLAAPSPTLLALPRSDPAD